jgi:hypothetical protein
MQLNYLTNKIINIQFLGLGYSPNIISIMIQWIFNDAFPTA